MAVCQNQTSVGLQYDGGFAEYLIVPQQVLKVVGLIKIPDNVGYDEAPAAEPFACAINAQELLGIEPSDSVVVLGAGPIGCMHTRIARGVHQAAPVYLVQGRAQRPDLLLRWTSNGSAPAHNKRALEYISTGQVPVKDLITRLIPLAEVMDAFGIVERGEAIKVTVEPSPPAPFRATTSAVSRDRERRFARPRAPFREPPRLTRGRAAPPARR